MKPKDKHNALSVTFQNYTAEDNIATDKLLTAFHRGSVMEQGAGVGLWLCNQIIVAHKGSLTIESASHMFTATVYLPVTSAN